jgi:hypothetical protein
MGAMTTGDVGQLATRIDGRLPLRSHSFSVLRISTPRELISAYLHQIDEVAGLSAKQAQKLRSLTAERLVQFPEDAGHVAQEQFKRDLEENVPMLKRAVGLAVRRQCGIDLQPSAFSLYVHRLSEGDWHTETDLGERLGLTPHQEHEVVASGLSAAGALSVHLETMQIFSALLGFQVGDLPLLEDRFAQLALQLDPDVHETRLTRVCEILGLPDPDPDPGRQDVDLPRLLDTTAGPEAISFRRWLRGVDEFTDQELADAFHPLRDAIGGAVRTPGARAVRLATTTGVGALLPPVGIGLSVLDTFLTEKILPGPGPTAFLSRLYPSIFRT